MKRTLIHNATIVNEGQSVKGSVVIEDGRIAEVLTNWKPLSAPCDETIDATGCYLLPGIIDDHVHFRDPGLTHKADILTESRAAAAGGVTSIMDMPNTNPVTTTLDALNAKLDLLNEKCIVTIPATSAQQTTITANSASWTSTASAVSSYSWAPVPETCW